MCAGEEEGFGGEHGAEGADEQLPRAGRDGLRAGEGRPGRGAQEGAHLAQEGRHRSGMLLWLWWLFGSCGSVSTCSSGSSLSHCPLATPRHSLIHFY